MPPMDVYAPGPSMKTRIDLVASPSLEHPCTRIYSQLEYSTGVYQQGLAFYHVNIW